MHAFVLAPEFLRVFYSNFHVNQVKCICKSALNVSLCEFGDSLTDKSAGIE